MRQTALDKLDKEDVMPTLNMAEEKFLNALRDYVDFRFLKGVDVPSSPIGDHLVSAFIEFLDSRPLKEKSTGDTVTVLIEKIVKMQESRGTGQPPPGDPPTPR